MFDFDEVWYIYIFQGSSDWMGPEDEPLTGFSWRGGCERDTTGILVWSNVFLSKLPNGEEVKSFLLFCFSSKMLTFTSLINTETILNNNKIIHICIFML